MVTGWFSELVIEKYQVVYSLYPAISVICVNISSSMSSWLFCMFPMLCGFMLSRRRRNVLSIARGHRTLIGTSGENIWQIQSQKTYTTRALAKQSMVNWMASPGHRANILKPDYTHLGVGVSMVRGKVTITQNFSGTAAYLDQALPKEIKRGEHLDFTMTSFGSFKPNAEYYEYWHEHKNERKSESIPIDNRQVNIKKGKYRLWFYFREKNSLWPGPVVEVR